MARSAAVLAKLSSNDMARACAAGAVVGGMVGYMLARNAEVQEARQATQAVTVVPGARSYPVQTQMVQVADRASRNTEQMQAFKSESTDIPVRQLDTPEGQAAQAKLEAYACKVAAERGDVVDASAPSKAGASKVTLRQSSEKVGDGMVHRSYTADPRVPESVQRVTIEVKTGTGWKSDAVRSAPTKSPQRSGLFVAVQACMPRIR